MLIINSVMFDVENSLLSKVKELGIATVLTASSTVHYHCNTVLVDSVFMKKRK